MPSTLHLHKRSPGLGLKISTSPVPAEPPDVALKQPPKYPALLTNIAYSVNKSTDEFGLRYIHVIGVVRKKVRQSDKIGMLSKSQFGMSENFTLIT